LLRSLTLLNTRTTVTAKQVSKFPKYLVLSGVALLMGASLPVLLRGIEKELYGQAFWTDPGRAAERGVWRKRWANADRWSLVSTSRGLSVRPDVRDESAR